MTRLITRGWARHLLVGVGVVSLLAGVTACAEDSTTEPTAGGTSSAAAPAASDAAGSDAAGSDAAGSDSAGSDAAGSDAAGSDAAGSGAAGSTGSEAAGSGAAGGDEQGEIKIGVVLDITGAGASLGVPERNTIEMLTKKINDAGGVNGRKLNVLIEDNQSKEDVAAQATTKLIQSEKVDILLGSSRTGPSLAMKAIAEQAQVPMISLAANQAIVDGSKWVFKSAQNDRVVLERIVDDMAAKGYHKVALARDASGFGEGIEEMFDELGKAAGIEITVTEKFAPDAKDFTAQMVNIRNADADAVLIWGIPPAAGLAQNSYVELKVGKPVYQSHGIGNQVFLDTAKANADGLIAPLGRLVVADQLEESDPQYQVITDYVKEYTAAYPGEPASTFGGHAYDAFMMAVDVIGKVGTDKAAVRDGLESVKDWPGISGVFTMTPEDHSGLSKDALVMVTVKDGKFALIDG